VIGVVGEIYVRANRFSNDNLVEQIEQLGSEAFVPSMAEWLHYSREMRSRRSWGRRSFGAFLANALRGKVQTMLERRIYGHLGLEPDPPVTQLLDLARPYLDDSFEGEAILTLGKSVELVRDHGVAGIINTMPFTCMPGTVVTALMKRVRDDYNGVPFLNMVYTGQQNLANRIRLEAFLYQARSYYETARRVDAHAAGVV
jgi:predicted nucleotide-binding protein (sugar kinase/HSP70/actin superfamily)